MSEVSINKDINKNITALILGMGPSLEPWLEKNIISHDLILYGSGRVPIVVNHYCYACVPKREYVPKTIRTLVYARPEVWESWMISWPDSWIRGGSAGSMGLCLACYHGHTDIGLIGFDGYGMPDYFISEFRGLLRYWRSAGKRLYTLMPDSVFNDLLLKD